MKKHRLLILLLFVLFSFTKVAKAETCDITKGVDCKLDDRAIALGAVRSIFSDSGIQTITCYFTPVGLYEAQLVGDEVKIRYTSDIINTKNVANRYQYNCSGTQNRTNTNKHFSFHGNIVPTKPSSNSVLRKTFSAGDGSLNVKTALGAKEIVEFTKSPKYSEYFEDDCGSDRCNVVAQKFGDTQTFSGTIRYKTALTEGSYELETDYTFSLMGDVVYATMSSGACSTDGWTNKEGTLFYKNKEDFSSLPSCQDVHPSYPYKKFAGWLQSNSAISSVGNDSCSGATKSPSTSYRFYYACYIDEPHFILYPSPGTIKNNTGTSFGGGYLFMGNSLTLPDVTPPERRKFVEWFTSDGAYSYAAGVNISTSKEVKLQAKFEDAEESTDAETTVYKLELDQHDTADVNSYFSLGIDKTKEVKHGCDSSKASSSKVGSDYIITAGGEPTGANYVVCKFEYTDTSGKKRIAKINVFVSDEESYMYIDPTEDEEDEIPPDEAPDPITMTTIGDLVSTGASACQEGYTIKWDKTTKVEMYTYAGSKNRLLHYDAKNHCDDNTYPAICMDPGLKAPNAAGKLYYPAEKLNYPQIDPSKGGWDAGMYYLAGVIHDNASQYFEVNFAARILTYKYGYGKTGGKYAKHADSYVAFVNQMSEDGTFPSNPSGFSMTSEGSSVIAGAQSIYKEALNYAGTSTASGSEDGNTLSAENTTHSTRWEGDVFVYRQEGTIASSGGVKVVGLEEACDHRYYSCDVVKATPNGNGLDYTVDVKIHIKTDSPAPNIDLNYTKFKIKVSGSDGSSGAAFLLYKATETNEYQRFVVFHPADGEGYLYVFFEDGDCKFILDALNGNCSDESSCGRVNVDWWQFLNCCDLVDADSYAYEYLCSGEDCFSENYLNECEYVAGGPIDTDIYSIREAETKDGTKKYKCIVAISRKCKKDGGDCDEPTKRQVTETKADLVNNKYAIKDYIDEHNEFCRVSCKEDWNIGSSAFGNYTGERAVQAGSYFMINRDLFVGTTRTCVTTKIDINDYAKRVESLANEMLEAWNKYNYYRYKWDALTSGKYKCDPWTGKFYKTKRTCYSYCGEDCEPTPYDCYDLDGTCQEYRLTLDQPIDYLIYDRDGTRREDREVNYSEHAYQGRNVANDSMYDEPTQNTDTGGFTGPPGQCSGTDNCDDLFRKIKEDAENNVDSYRTQVDNLRRKIQDLVDDFVVCQNFTLNVSKGEFQSKGSNILPAYGHGMGYTTEESVDTYNVDTREISSLFSPFMLYTYDEDEYMKVLNANKENYMVKYTKVNNDYMTDYDGKNNERVELPGVEDDVGNQIYLARNFYTTDKYKADPDDRDIDESIYNDDPLGVKRRLLYEGESVLEFGNKKVEELKVDKFSICSVTTGYGIVEGTTNKCAMGKFFYYDANFIKHTLSNSSFFKNYGDWYINALTDEKVHANSITQTERIPDPDNWSLYGGHNVFPVSMDTKRNLYKYEYKFYNIGAYNDGTLGRIMGRQFDFDRYEVVNPNKNVLIEENYHDCLYEVYESICRCCGEEIVTYAYDITAREGEDPPDYINETGAEPGNSTNTVINEARISAYTNTVSLSNLASSTRRVLGANWQARTPLYLGGKLYEDGTDQGLHLLKGIEEKGDELYNDKPEYSYILNPSTLTSIRDYNKTNSYVPDTTSGKFTAAEGEGNGTGFKKSGSDWLVSTSEANSYLRFFHYKSKYLKDTLSAYETPAYSSYSFTKRSKICEISGSSTALEAAVKELVKNGPSSDCLWVDYITTVHDAVEGKNITVRLAFK